MQRSSVNFASFVGALRLSMALVLSMLAEGCTDPHGSWKEEVQLASGEVVQVIRTVRFKEYQGFGGGGGSDPIESTLSLISPQRSDNPARWSRASLLPMVLDRDPGNGEWFIVATFYMCTAWYDLGRPRLPYAEFRYRGGEWVRVPLSEGLVGREANVWLSNQAGIDRDYPISEKRKLMAEPTIAPMYQRIVSNWKTSC